MIARAASAGLAVHAPCGGETSVLAARSSAMRLDFDLAQGALPRNIVHEQVAAIPVRLAGESPQVLLVTTRSKGRWTAPKGWPATGTPNCACAAREAYEEAGVTGDVETFSLGQFSYQKKTGSALLLYSVTAFLLRVTKTHPIWPERTQRMRTWFPLHVAQSLVNNDELAEVMEEAVRRFRCAPRAPLQASSPEHWIQ